MNINQLNVIQNNPITFNEIKKYFFLHFYIYIDMFEAQT